MRKPIAGLALTLLSTSLLAQTQNETAALLQHKDQSLPDAVATGDRDVWDGMIASDFIYADENNRVIERADFLKELVPLPQGSSGNMVIRSYEMHRDADTAIVEHRDDETEQYFGSELHAQYLMTETWQLRGNEWKLRVVHCAAIPIDALTIVLTRAQMDELVGTYRAGTLTYVVRRDGARLFGAQPGHPETELKPETRDVLVVSGQPRSRRVFTRDGSGAVTGFADRRENRDLMGSRLKSSMQSGGGGAL